MLTPQGISEKITLTKVFLQRKLKEYDALKAEIAAMSDGCDADELSTMQQRFER